MADGLARVVPNWIIRAAMGCTFFDTVSLLAIEEFGVDGDLKTSGQTVRSRGGGDD